MIKLLTDHFQFNFIVNYFNKVIKYRADLHKYLIDKSLQIPIRSLFSIYFL